MLDGFLCINLSIYTVGTKFIILFEKYTLYTLFIHSLIVHTKTPALHGELIARGGNKVCHAYVVQLAVEWRRICAAGNRLWHATQAPFYRVANFRFPMYLTWAYTFDSYSGYVIHIVAPK